MDELKESIYTNAKVKLAFMIFLPSGHLISEQYTAKWHLTASYNVIVC